MTFIGSTGAKLREWVDGHRGLAMGLLLLTILVATAIMVAFRLWLPGCDNFNTRLQQAGSAADAEQAIADCPGLEVERVRWALVADMVFPIAYATALSLAIYLMTRSWSAAWERWRDIVGLVPIAAAILDMFPENTSLLIWSWVGWPPESGGEVLLAIAWAASTVKIALLILSVVFALGLCAWSIWRWLRSESSRLKRVIAWLAVAGATMCLVLMREIDLLLKSIDSGDQRSYGAWELNRLRINPSSAVTDVPSAAALWATADNNLADRLLQWQMWTSLFFILAYSVALFLLMRAWEGTAGLAGLAPVLVGALAVLDALESVIGSRATIQEIDDPGSVADAWFRVFAVAGLLKWVALVLCLIYLFVLLSAKNFDPVFGGEAHAHSWFRLLPLGALVGVFGLAIALPGGSALDQFPDVLRANLEDEGAQTLALVATPLLLAVAVVYAGLRSAILVDRSDDRPDPPEAQPLEPRLAQGTPRASKWVAAAAVSVAGAALLFCVAKGEGLKAAVFAVPAVMLAIVAIAFVVDWLVRLTASQPQLSDAEFRFPSTTQRNHLFSVVASLTGAVILIVSIGLVRATARPVLIFTGAPSYGVDYNLDTWSGWLVAAGAIAIASALVAELVTSLRGLDRDFLRKVFRWLAIPMWLVTVATCVALAGWPERWAPVIGSLGVLSVAFALLALLLGELRHHQQVRPPWRAISVILPQARATPYLTIALLALLLATNLDRQGGYHDVPLIGPEGDTAAALRHDNLEAAYREWSQQPHNCEGVVTDDRKVRPMLFVAGPGGGARAAYWTALGLEELAKQCSDSIFAVSAVSGSTLGTSAWMYPLEDPSKTDPAGIVAELSEDHGLATAIAGLLLRDAPHRFFPFQGGWSDRATLMADAWQEQLDEISDSIPVTFDGLSKVNGWVPAIVFNGASGSDGCRVLTTNVGYLRAEGGYCLGSSGTENPGAVSAAENTRARTFPASTPDLGDSCFSPDDPPRTPEEVELLASGVVPIGVARSDMSTPLAVLMSARFPGILPAGAVRRCQGYQVSSTYVLDGGYIENTGMFTLLQMWEQIEPLVVQNNADPTQPLIAPWFVLLDNHYRPSSPRVQSKRAAESAMPFQAYVSSRASYGPTAFEQIAQRELRSLSGSEDVDIAMGELVVIAPRQLPSVAAPLGWVLSDTTRSEMRRQFAAQWQGPSCNTTISRLQQSLEGALCPAP